MEQLPGAFMSAVKVLGIAGRGGFSKDRAESLYEYNGDLIWGATARMMKNFMEIIDNVSMNGDFIS